MARWMIYLVIGALLVAAFIWLGRLQKVQTQAQAPAGALPRPEGAHEDAGGDESFWRLIGLIDRKALLADTDGASTAVEPLVEALAALNRGEIENFEDVLTAKLYALDGRNFAQAAGPNGDSDDAFLYARCFVVARGRAFFETVLENPANMPSETGQWCEPLLLAAENAWERKTGETWIYVPELSSESGSNTAQW